MELMLATTFCIMAIGILGIAVYVTYKFFNEKY